MLPTIIKYCNKFYGDVEYARIPANHSGIDTNFNCNGFGAAHEKVSRNIGGIKICKHYDSTDSLYTTM